jgi:hypothetical protein
MPVAMKLYQYQYASDDGNAYNTKLSPAFAAAGGFTPGTAGLPTWARKHQTKNTMRRVHCVSADGTQRKTVEFATASGYKTFIAANLTITINSIVYNVTGWEGEKQELTQNPPTGP